MRRPDSPDEAAFRAEARAWLDANAELRSGTDADWSRGPRNASPEAEAAHLERCRAWQRKRHAGGWSAITWPRAFGGRGGTPAQAMIFAEEEARYDVTTGFIQASLDLIGPALIQYGTREQCERYLPVLLAAEEIWCQLFSEPGAGSDLAALRTRAERDGDHFVVNGQKVWTTSAQYSDRGYLLARTNPDVPKHAGISFLIVDMRAPGVEVRPLITITGGAHFNEVFFQDVRVPVENVIGEVDAGWAVARTTLANESMSIGSSSFGGSSAMLVELARQRGLQDDSHVRQRIAQAFVEERVLDFFRDRLQGAIREGRMPELDGSVTKIFWAESRMRRDELAVELQGPEGMLDHGDAPAQGLWQEGMLNRYMGTIGGGTLEVHRNGIGERVLGLPREPRSDRDVPFRDLKSS